MVCHPINFKATKIHRVRVSFHVIPKLETFLVVKLMVMCHPSQFEAIIIHRVRFFKVSVRPSQIIAVPSVQCVVNDMNEK